MESQANKNSSKAQSVSAYPLSPKQIETLILSSFEAREKSYSPYSHFSVGAALLTKNETIYQGCNIENAAYTPSNCAERTAFFKAIFDGEKEFRAIAIAGGMHQQKIGEVNLCSPCGVCRQVMLEFCQKDFIIILATDKDHYELHTLEELTPFSFSADNLEK